MGKTGHIYLISDHTILFYFTQSVVTYQLVWKPMIRPLFVRESSPKIVAMEKCQEHREETSSAVGSLIFLARELREQRAVDLSSRTSVAIQADFCVFHGVAKSMLVGRDLWGHSDSVLQKSLVAAFRSNSYLDLFKYMIPQIILKERPRVISSAVGHAWDLPANTFGAAYAKFMGSRNFSPDDRPPVRFMETEELAYVATRAREIHDFWHVLFNLPTNMLGESALKVVEFQQMYLPMCLLSVVGGSMRLKEKKREHFFKYYFPWAVRAGMSCTDIMSVYYEKYFDEDLEVVRHKWGILPAPDLQSIGTSLKS